MKFSQPQADVFVPKSNQTPEAALARVTHLCVAAHQDDIEIMAFAGVADCLDQAERAFGGVVVTNGAGSPRAGAYAAYSDEQMQVVRRQEQRAAAKLGRYAIQIQLAHPSANVKQPRHPDLAADLAQVFAGCRPVVVYLHNPADKHDTHVAVMLRCLDAIRALPVAQRPQRVLGCEVWRDLDWLPDSLKVALDSGRHPELADQLLKVFDSQIGGGKRYDLATLGRRAANATYHTSHATDVLAGITWAMDLTPLIQDAAPSVDEFVGNLIGQLRADVADRLQRLA